MEIKLAKDPILYKEPRRFLFYGAEKIGKTSIVTELDNAAILDLDDGSGFKECIRYQIRSLTDLEDFRDAHIAAGYPHKFIVVDTITKLEEFVHMLATRMYMGTNQGKGFNKDKAGKILPESEWDMVVDVLGQNGYRWFTLAWRYIMDEIVLPMGNESTRFIFIGHVKDKFIDPNSIGKTVSTKELNLTGKNKDITLQHYSDCNAYAYRTSQGELEFSFKSDSLDVSAGSRIGPVGQVIKAKDLWKTLYPDSVK
jgi:hypothetical protein